MGIAALRKTKTEKKFSTMPNFTAAILGNCRVQFFLPMTVKLLCALGDELLSYSTILI